MTQQKQMTDKELDQVSGGSAFVKLGDLRGRQASRHIIHPQFLQIVHPELAQSKNGKPFSATDNDHKDW